MDALLYFSDQGIEDYHLVSPSDLNVDHQESSASRPSSSPSRAMTHHVDTDIPCPDASSRTLLQLLEVLLVGNVQPPALLGPARMQWPVQAAGSLKAWPSAHGRTTLTPCELQEAQRGQLTSPSQHSCFIFPSALSCVLPLDSTSTDLKGTPNTHPQH